MKMKPEHIAGLKRAINEVIATRTVSLKYITEQYQAQGLTEMRLRWDLLHSIPAEVRNPMMKEFYEYLNDIHIDTALKHIVAELIQNGLQKG